MPCPTPGDLPNPGIEPRSASLQVDPLPYEPPRKPWISNLYWIIRMMMVRASLIAQLVENPPAMQETQFNSWVRKISWGRDRLPTPVFLGFPCGSAGKEFGCNVCSVPGLGRFSGEGKGYLIQYSSLENSMGYVVHGVTKNQTGLSNFHFHKDDNN